MYWYNIINGINYNIMKKTLLFALGLVFVSLISCSKGGDEEDAGPDCENDNTCTVKLTNTGTQPLRVAIAYQLTPQYQPIDPTVDITLAPGATQTKTIKSGRYMIVWFNNCATSCNRLGNFGRTYESCESYDEKQGI